jgi:hypothetical protein
MLAVQPDMPGELVHEHACGEADIGATSLEYPGRCRQTDDLGAGLDLDCGPTNFEDMVGAGALSNPVRHLLADDDANSASGLRCALLRLVHFWRQISSFNNWRKLARYKIACVISTSGVPQ